MLICTILLVFSQFHRAHSWKLSPPLLKRYHVVSEVLRMSSTAVEPTPTPNFAELNFKSLAVSGFSSLANNFADDFVASKIFKKVAFNAYDL